MAPEKKSTQSVTLVKTSEKYSVLFAPGKQSSKQGDVQVSLYFDKPFFNAGGHLSGRLELTCGSEELVMLGQISIEVTGFEDVERTSKNTSLRRRIFYKSKLVLQEQGSPSDAVKPNALPDVDGYYPAKAGKTHFPFSLELSNNLPSSYISKIGGVRYVISGAALIQSNQRKESLAHNRFAQVYERWTEFEVEHTRTMSTSADNSEQVHGETKERISMVAEVTKGMVTAGGLIYVNALVNNLGKKSVSGVKLSLWQLISGNHDLIRTNSGGRLAPGIDNRVLVTEAVYYGHDWTIPFGESREFVVALGVPPSCYSLRNTTLIQVSYEIQIDLVTSFCKWKPLRLPIYVAHPSSWSDVPPNFLRREPQSFSSTTAGRGNDTSTIKATNSFLPPPVPAFEPKEKNLHEIVKNSRRVSISRKDTVRRKVRPSSIGTLCESVENSPMILRVTNPDITETFLDSESKHRLPDIRKRASTITRLSNRPSIAQHRRQSTQTGITSRRPQGLRTISETLDHHDDSSSLIEIGDRILTQHGLRPSFEGTPHNLEDSVATPPRRSVTIQQLEELQEQIELPETNSDESPLCFYDGQEEDMEQEKKSLESEQRLDQHMYPIVAQRDHYQRENSGYNFREDRHTKRKGKPGHPNRLIKKNTKMRVRLSRSDTVTSIQTKLTSLQYQMDTILTFMDTEPLPALKHSIIN